MKYNPPPGWPSSPPGWKPPPGWSPPPSWPRVPPGWRFWTRAWYERPWVIVAGLFAGFVGFVVVVGIVSPPPAPSPVDRSAAAPVTPSAGATRAVRPRATPSPSHRRPAPSPSHRHSTPVPRPTVKKKAAVPPVRHRKVVLPTCGAPRNPYRLNLCGRGSLVYSPPDGVCGYFDCIDYFENGSGYMVRCNDGMYGLSGGRRGACSSHRGEGEAVRRG